MSAARARKLLQLLYQVFPGAFIAPGKGRCRPLKTGIRNDLEPIVLAWGFSSADLQRALIDYTKHIRYWSAVAGQSVRVDLMGQPAGEVSLAHRANAKTKLRIWRQQAIVRAERYKRLLKNLEMRRQQRALGEARKKAKEERKAKQRQMRKHTKKNGWIVPSKKTAIPIPLAMQKKGSSAHDKE